MGGKIGPADFTAPLTSPVIDSNSSAVVLSDEGAVRFIGNNKGWFSYVFKRRTRIRILNKKGLEAANVFIQLYAPGDDPEKISDVGGSTYNLENGSVTELKLDPKDIFQERRDKEYIEAKFSLPGVKEGSIFEYTYTITSDHDFRLPSWRFQWMEYPCLWSDYQVEIPQALFYVILRQGVHPYAIDKGSEGHASYNVREKKDQTVALVGQEQSYYVTAVTVKHDWAMKDVPAFGPETYLTTARNYLDQISFQLSKTYDGAQYHDVANSWANLNETLLKREDFGLPLEADAGRVADETEKIVAGITDPLDRAKRVYYYLTSHLTCTDYYYPFIKTGLGPIWKKYEGSVGDINLLLVAMLRKLGLHADPVLLSTRENGFTVASYPMLERLNYVIARLKLNDKVYYLDAAHRQLGFGQVAGDCYNGPARIICNTDSGSVSFSPDSLKERKVTMVLIAATDKGLEGQLQSTLGAEESYRVRRDVGKRGEEAWFKDIQTSWGDDMTISNGGIDSLANPEDPVKVHYEFAFRQSPDASILYLPPMLGEAYRRNPFQAAERKYPVEMPYAMDETYVLSMEIPPGYVVDELPKSAKVAFNVDQGYFEYLIQQSGDHVQMRCRIKLNKASFQPEDYSPLRDFFGYVVKKENEPIVLKKK
jgi:hypothetical protein